MKLPQVSNITTLADTGIFRIESLDITFSNGAKRTYQRLNPTGNGAVLVIPVFEGGKFAMIYEYSGGTQKYELALPKGKIDSGETIIEAANRELQEEIGFAARNLVHLKTMTLAPGYQANKTHIVLATDLYESSKEGDEPEELQVVYNNFSDLETLVYKEDLSEARSIAALYMARNYIINNT
jgi:ADP-ribose diphosphatase